MSGSIPELFFKLLTPMCNAYLISPLRNPAGISNSHVPSLSFDSIRNATLSVFFLFCVSGTFTLPAAYARSLGVSLTPFFFSLCIPTHRQVLSDPSSDHVSPSPPLWTSETASSSRSLLPFFLSQRLNATQQAERSL